MDYEAKGFLTEHAESVAKESALSVSNDYDELPNEVKTLLAAERMTGKLDGMYTMFLTLREKDRDDDAEEEIDSIVGDHYRLFMNLFDVDPDEISDDRQ